MVINNLKHHEITKQKMHYFADKDRTATLRKIIKKYKVRSSVYKQHKLAWYLCEGLKIPKFKFDFEVVFPFFIVHLSPIYTTGHLVKHTFCNEMFQKAMVCFYFANF